MGSRYRHILQAIVDGTSGTEFIRTLFVNATIPTQWAPSSCLAAPHSASDNAASSLYCLGSGAGATHTFNAFR